MSGVVIPLPTAAPKKVRQRWSQTRAADRKALLRFPAQPSPWERSKAERKALARQADLPSFVLVIRALAQVLTIRDQRRVALGLALSASCTGGPEACAWWQLFVMEPGMSWKGDDVADEASHSGDAA